MEIVIRADEGNWVRFQTDDGAQLLRDSQLKLPRRFEACYPDDRGGPELRLRIEMRGGIPQCRQLLLCCLPDGREIRQSDIRSADLDLYLEVACQLAAPHVSALPVLSEGELAYPDVQAGHVQVARSVSRARRNTRRQIPDDKLGEVAEVYRASPQRPAAAVAERFGLALRTASLYVRRARDAGLLEEAGHGKHQEAP